MVDVVDQLCVKSYELKAQNGDHFKAHQGATYTTTVPVDGDPEVTVFTRYWVKVPKEHFVLKEK